MHPARDSFEEMGFSIEQAVHCKIRNQAIRQQNVATSSRKSAFHAARARTGKNPRVEHIGCLSLSGETSPR